METEVLIASAGPTGLVLALWLARLGIRGSTCEAAFLAGCDRAHSTVRQRLGTGFGGGTYEDLFYVADVDAGGPLMDRALRGRAPARILDTHEPERIALDGRCLRAQALGMSSPQVIVATWDDGLFVIGTETSHELAGHALRGLAFDRRGGVLAIVDGKSLRRRDADGTWQTLAHGDVELACCLAMPDAILVGTEDARVLHLDAAGELEPIPAFDRVGGRETWYAGTAMVDGELRGPPLGVRSMCATCDDRTILVNVHVGGICRSTDGGRSWHPTIDVEADVHEVCVHPRRPEVLAAAAAVGLCLSTDGGASWSKERDGLHAPHCSAVAFSGDDVLVAAATDPFAPEGAVYRRSITAGGALRPIEAGLPRWFVGLPDTACVATRDAHIAIVDRAACLYRSADHGRSWSRHAARLPIPSSVLLG